MPKRSCCTLETPGGQPSSGLGLWGTSRRRTHPDFLVPRQGQGVRIHLDESDRTHLDLWVDRTTSDLNTEVERLIALGAGHVERIYPEDPDFVVLVDTEGNLFLRYRVAERQRTDI